MKKIIYLVLFSFFISAAWAQQAFFVYLQSDNKQPFYVKLNEKVFSSTPAGYLVVPKLPAGEHNILVGFPKAEWPQQNWVVKINNKDEGFILKNFDAKGWGLFNLNTLDVMYAGTAPVKETPAKNSNTDLFSEMLAAVVNTPGLNDVTIAEKPAETIKKEEHVVTTIAAAEQPAPPAGTVSVIRKLESIEDNGGQALTFIDQSDTIKIFIPTETSAANKSIAELTPVQPEASGNAIVTDTNVTIPAAPVVRTNRDIKQTQSPSPAFMDIELPNPNTVPDTSQIRPGQEPAKVAGEEQAVVSAPAKKTAIEIFNSDCKKLAEDDDFLKLRKKMTSYTTDDEMVNAAKKIFKTRCFTTEQVKNLSVLFLSDAGKYQFFDAAYPFVYDSSRFSSLLNQLSDPYYINRFKAMVRL